MPCTPTEGFVSCKRSLSSLARGLAPRGGLEIKCMEPEACVFYWALSYGPWKKLPKKLDCTAAWSAGHGTPVAHLRPFFSTVTSSSILSLIKVVTSYTSLILLDQTKVLSRFLPCTASVCKQGMKATTYPMRKLCTMRHSVATKLKR